MTLSSEQRIGRFTLVRMLGASSLATVHEARDPDTGRRVALKVLSRYLAEDRNRVEQFFSVARRLATLGHPNIVALVEMGQGDLPWLATEFMDQGSLKQRAGTPMEPAEVVRVIGQVGAALDAAHGAGVLHGDLKPANVFATSTGDYKLGDFGMAGLARGIHPLIRSSSSTPLAAYMSPEQALDMTFTERSDVYSLGVLAYHLLTGQVPFQGMDPTTVWAKQLKGPPAPPSLLSSGVPAALDQVVLTALAANPQQRFGSGAAFAQALQAAVEQGGVGSSTPQPLASGHVAAPERLLTTVAPNWAQPMDEDAEAADEPLPAAADDGSTLARAAAPFAKMGGRARSALALALAVLTLVPATMLINRATLPPTPLSTVSASALPGQWGMYQRDPAHTGYSPGPTPVFQGSVRWSFMMSEPLLASPAVDADTVYLATGDRRIVALRVADGSIRWEVPVSGPVDGTPAFAEGLVYVGLRDGTVLAIDRGNGTVRWQHNTGGAIVSSTLVYKGALYIGTGRRRLEALDARTGKSLWHFEADEWVTSSPAITEDGVLVFGARDGNIYFLDAATGKKRLTYRTVFPIEAAPAVAGDVAYVGVDNGNVVALDTNQQQRPLDKKIFRFKSQFYAWNMWPSVPVQRGLLWRATPGRTSTSAPALTDSLLVIVTRDGRVHGIDKETGGRKWTFTTRTTASLPPIVAGDTVFVSSTSGVVYGLNVATGEKTWEWSPASGLRPSTGPVIAGGVLYAGASQERPVITFKRMTPDGAPLAEESGLARDNWFYQMGATPCSPGEKKPVGPFASQTEASTAANFSAPGCGVLYAIR